MFCSIVNKLLFPLLSFSFSTSSLQHISVRDQIVYSPPTLSCSAPCRAHCVACRPSFVSHSPGAINSTALRGSLNSPGSAQSCKSERLLLSLRHVEGAEEKPSCHFSHFEVEQEAAAAVHFLFQETHFEAFSREQAVS